MVPIQLRADCAQSYGKCVAAVHIADGIIHDQDAIIRTQDIHVKEITQQLVDLSALAKTQQDEVALQKTRNLEYALGGFALGALAWPLATTLLRK